jgi:galactokinase
MDAGMSRAAAEAKSDLFGRAVDAVPGHPAANAEPYMLFVPGRIEVLGKHTDYAGGRSLVTAVERGFCMAAIPRNDSHVSVIDVHQGRKADFELHPELAGAPGEWSAYPMTVARRIARNFPGPLRGADMAFLSDLPPASGMSSSSALMIATFKVLDHANALLERPEARAEIHSPEDLAGYLATIENGRSFGSLTGDRGVGTFGGSEDHTAICCCRAGRLHLYSFCPTRQERVLPMPPAFRFAVAYCGVLAEKTGGAMDEYNRASQLVAALVELWQAETGGRGLSPSRPSLADIIRSAPDAADRLRDVAAGRPHAGFDSAALLGRLEHFLGESERIIPAAADALTAGQIGPFGRLVDESQSGAEHLLKNQVPQTVHLARSARECGAAAASAFGAGFGGSVWALVEEPAAEAFLAEWACHYRKAFPSEAEHAVFFSSGAGPCLTESAATAASASDS